MFTVKVDAGKVTVVMASGLESLSGPSATLMYRNIGEKLQIRIKEGFAGEHAPDGEAWEPLSPATIRRRQKGKGGIVKMLQDKRHLQNSLKPVATAESVVIAATNVKYAAIHQFGGTITRTAKIHFRRIKRGKGKGGVRFTKKNDTRASFGMATRPYTIKIPARPYLFNRDGSLPQPWLDDIAAVVTRYLGAANG